jgi:hypothetical protein
LASGGALRTEYSVLSTEKVSRVGEAAGGCAFPFASAFATAAESSEDSSPAISLNDLATGASCCSAGGSSWAGTALASAGLRSGRRSIGGGEGFIGLIGVALRCEPMRMRFFSDSDDWPAESSGDGAVGSVFITTVTGGGCEMTDAENAPKTSP